MRYNATILCIIDVFLCNAHGNWKYRINNRCSPKRISFKRNNFMQESRLSLSSTETDSNIFPLVLHCVCDEK